MPSRTSHVVDALTYDIIKWRDAVHAAHQLTFAERLCLLQMQTYADSKTGRCIPGNKTIALKVGCSVTICTRAWVKAVDAGLMTRDQRYKGDRQTTCVTYLTVPAERPSVETVVTGGVKLRFQGGVKLRLLPRTSQEGISQMNKESPPSSAETESSIPAQNPHDDEPTPSAFETTEQPGTEAWHNEPQAIGPEPHEENEMKGKTDWTRELTRTEQLEAKMDAEPECSGYRRQEPTGISARNGDTLATAKAKGWTDGNSDQMRADLAKPVPAPVHYVPQKVRINTFPDNVVRHNLISLEHHQQTWNIAVGVPWQHNYVGWILQWLDKMDAEQYVKFIDTCAMKPRKVHEPIHVVWMHTVMLGIMNGQEYRYQGNDRTGSTGRRSGNRNPGMGGEG